MNDEPIQLNFDALVTSRADVWNTTLATHLGVTVSRMRDLIMLRVLGVSDPGEKMEVTRETIKRLADAPEEASVALSAFTVEVGNDSEASPAGVSLVGKVVVGMNLSGAVLNDSHFSHCTFYRCDFAGASVENCTVNSCVFVNCAMDDSEWSGSVLYRTRFYECSLDGSYLDYCTASECMFVVCRLCHVSANFSRFLGTGFIDAVAKGGSFRDAVFTLATMSNCDFTGASFRRGELVDGILVRSDFRGCDFSQFVIANLTSNSCDRDPSVRVFDMNDGVLYPPGCEWDEQLDEDEDDERE